MNQSATNSKSETKRTASDLLRATGGALIAIAVIAAAVAVQFKLPIGIPVAIIAGILGLAIIVGSVFSGVKERQKGRMAAFLAAELGSDWDPKTGLQASQFKDGMPRKVAIRYQERMPDHDPEWRKRLTEMVRARMGVDDVKATWNERRNLVTFEGVAVTDPLEKSRRLATARIQQFLSPMFRRVELRVTVPTWQGDNSLDPKRINLSYGVTTLDGSELFRRQVEAITGLKLGGRWRSHFDPTRDIGYLEPRPELPSNVPHPGISLYTGANKPDPKSPVLYYGVDENGDPRGWTIGKKSTMPHGLYIGPTGGGKTTVLRSLIFGAVSQRIPVFGADPKMIELTPFYGYPGCFIASTPAEIAAMIESMEKLMYERYDLIKKNPAAASTLSPVLFILDELLILRQVLKRYYKEIGGKGMPPWFDSISALLALARSAMINVAIGVQRPDASLFDDGARDNLRQRLSLMRLSPQGSEMLWGTRYVGVDLPMVQGRAMASPDGENPIEIQTFWAADPISATGNDRAVIEEIRAHAERLFEDWTPPVDVTPFQGEMPVIDLDALPKPVDAEVAAIEEQIREAQTSLVNLDAQKVKAEGLVEGDEIILEDGSIATVAEVKEDPYSEDSSVITIETNDGLEDISFSNDHYVSRVLSLDPGASPE